MVRVAADKSFVVADIPGLIEGAADGAGLGIRFLKHLERCRVLLHMIDLLPVDGTDPVDNAFTIIDELNQYSEKLADKPRWLVFNKVDLMPEDEAQAQIERVLDALAWDDKHYAISAINKANVQPLIYDLMASIEALPAPKPEVEPEDETVAFKWMIITKNSSSKTTIMMMTGMIGTKTTTTSRSSTSHNQTHAAADCSGFFCP